MRIAFLCSAAFAVATAAVFAEMGCSSSNDSAGSSSVPEAGVDAGGPAPETGGDAASDGGSSCAPVYQSDADLMMPTVSFRSDVMPLLGARCTTTRSCHGLDPQTAIATRGLFLGCSGAQLEAGVDSGGCEATGDITELVYGYLVGDPDAGPEAGPLPPIEITGMPFVTPGDPSQSYLMHKLDGDQCNLMSCVPNNAAVTAVEDLPGTTPYATNWCGQYMPYNMAQLGAGTVCGGSADCMSASTFSRDTVRAWIAQGAQNN